MFNLKKKKKKKKTKKKTAERLVFYGNLMVDGGMTTAANVTALVHFKSLFCFGLDLAIDNNLIVTAT